MPEQPKPAGSAPSELLELVGVALRNAKLLVSIPIALAIGTVLLFLVLPPKYTTTVSFAPVSPDLPAGGLAALAGQVGVTLGTDATASPDFLASLLQTRELLEPIARNEYSVKTSNGIERTALADLLKTRRKDDGFTTAATIQTLQESVLDVSIARRSGLVVLSVKTKWPELSVSLAEELAGGLDSLLFAIRQQRATAESRFLQSQLDVARRELEGAENRLAGFLQRNRSYAQDPVLSAEHDRIRRDVNLRAEVFSFLTQGFEQARTAAARNTPSLSIIEPPRPPLRFDRRRMLQKAAGGFFLGTIVSLILLATKVAEERLGSSWIRRIRDLMSRPKVDSTAEHSKQPVRQ